MTPQQRTNLENKLRHAIAAGYDDAADALKDLEDALEHVSADAGFRAEFATLAAALEQGQRAKEATWSTPTANDRLEAAFAELDAAGIVALQNAGWTQTDGWEEIGEATEHRQNVRGGVFFHSQDTERAMEGGGLMLTFGVVGEGGAAASAVIGEETAATLRSYGLTVEWNGRVDARLLVKPFIWQKRRFTTGQMRSVNILTANREHHLRIVKTCQARLGLSLTTVVDHLDALAPRDSAGGHPGKSWCVARGLSPADAESLAVALRDAGACIELR